jgi:hypothetical protein
MKRALIVMVALMSAAHAHATDAVKLEWPANPHFQRLIAYLSASLLPVYDTPAKPTLEQRLRAAPFFTTPGRVYLNLETLDEAAAQALRDASQIAGSGLTLAPEKFLPVAENLYLERRYFSANLAALHEYLNFKNNPEWVFVDVRSIISGGIRRVWYNVRMVTETVLAGLDSGQPLKYKRGAWFLAEHLDHRGNVTETHATGKRPDWEWDFALYDEHGVAKVVSPGNSMIRAPTMCFNCHHRPNRVAPFAEFPDASPPMSGFQPEVLVTLSPADAQIVRKLAFTKADDQVLGHYGGLAALKLREWQRAGTMPDWAKPLWTRLVAHVPELAR